MNNPDLGLYFFFSEKLHGEADGLAWANSLLTRWGMALLKAATPATPTTPAVPAVYESELATPTSYRDVNLYPLQDSWVVYVSLDCKGPQLPSVWQTLQQDALGQDWQELPTATSFWGWSAFFGAIVPSRPDVATQTAWLRQIILPPATATAAAGMTAQATYPWGEVWQLCGTHDWARPLPQIYVLLFLEDQQAALQDRLFTKSNGLNFLALNLTKAYYQLGQFQQLKGFWRGQRTVLEQDIQARLTPPPTPAPPPIDLEQELNRIRRGYVAFYEWANQVMALHQTIKLDTENYRQTATKLQLLNPAVSDLVFTPHLSRLAQAQKQLLANSRYDSLARERLSIGLQTIQAELDFALAKMREQQEEREGRTQKFLAWIAVLLGLTQLYPLIQDIMLYWPGCTDELFLCSNNWRWTLDGLILVGFFLAAKKLWQDNM